MKVFALLTLAGIAFFPASVSAQHDGHTAAENAASPFAAANQAMMDSMMSLPSTGDPDKDFALMMIPHHEGAIAMAKVVLEHGDDPEIRALAEAIVSAQQGEIDWMKAWLAKQPE